MADKIKALLGVNENGATGGGDKHNLRVAVCALLLETANVDFEFAPSEKETIVAVLTDQFQMNETELEELIQHADALRVRYPDLGPFTRTINEAFSEAEKAELLLMLWQVVAADKRLDAYEELLMRRLQPALGVSQEMVDEARQRAYGSPHPLDGDPPPEQ